MNDSIFDRMECSRCKGEAGVFAIFSKRPLCKLCKAKDRAAMKEANEQIRAGLAQIRQQWFDDVAAGNLPVVNNAPIILTSGEQCHLMAPATLLEEHVNLRLTGDSIGVAVPIGHSAVSLGSNEYRWTETKQILPSDKGNIYITSNRFVFVGAAKTIIIPLSEVVTTTLHANTIEFHTAGKTVFQGFVVADGLAIGALVKYLGSNQ